MINIDSNELQKLYIAYFGRPGDPSGINYWLSRVNESITIREISHELSRQDEYKQSISQDKSIDFKINKLYLNLFNRKADFEGLNYWMDRINVKDYQIADVVFELLYSTSISFQYRFAKSTNSNTLIFEDNEGPKFQGFANSFLF